MSVLYLIAEYCEGPFYMGWWLYVRESKRKQQRNRDGGWGWIQYGPAQRDWDRQLGRSLHPCREIFDALGISREIVGGDGDEGAIAEFAFAHPLPRSMVGGKPRGCVEIAKDEWGALHLAPAPEPSDSGVNER